MHVHGGGSGGAAADSAASARLLAAVEGLGMAVLAHRIRRLWGRAAADRAY